MDDTPRARSISWRAVAPFVGVWIAAGVAVSARATPRSSMVHTGGTPFLRLFNASPPSDSSSAMRAVVVAQRRDCEGNLSIAAVLSRRAVSRQVPIRAVLIEGSAADTTALRARLPTALRRATIGLLQDNERAALQAIGHQATPLLLLFDARGRLRLSAPVSADPVHVIAIRRAIEHLVTNNPLP